MKICIKCGNPKPLASFQSKGNGQRRGVCRACRRRVRRKGTSLVVLYAGHDENHRICIKCKIEKHINDFKIVKSKNLYTCKLCWKPKKKRVNIVAKRLNNKLRKLRIRTEVINYYGGKCAFCDNDEIIFLTIDHVGGGGNVHRKEVKNPNICIWLMSEKNKTGLFPSGYQVLCWNCNSAKHIHGEEVVKAAIMRLRNNA